MNTDERGWPRSTNGRLLRIVTLRARHGWRLSRSTKSDFAQRPYAMGAGHRSRVGRVRAGWHRWRPRRSTECDFRARTLWNCLVVDASGCGTAVSAEGSRGAVPTNRAGSLSDCLAADAGGWGTTVSVEGARGAISTNRATTLCDRLVLDAGRHRGRGAALGAVRTTRAAAHATARGQRFAFWASDQQFSFWSDGTAFQRHGRTCSGHSRSTVPR
jgi:hypothetical protein